MQSREKWYVVRTKTRQEAVAQVNLDRQDFKTYLPTIKVAKRRAGKWAGVIEPLFPGYLFVEVDVMVQSTAPIANTRGAIGLVRFGGEVCPVPSGIIDGIMRLQSDHDAPIEPAQVFKQGDTVTIVEGPFAGVNAIFHAQSGKERVCLLLDLMGRSNTVEVCSHQVVPA
jgi:transcriptional antiterminator RfaH